MAHSMAVIFVLLYSSLGILDGHSEGEIHDVNRPNEELLEDVFVATEKLSKFFMSDYSQVNVDGLFGLRLGQGQLIDALNECDERRTDPELVERLNRLQGEVETTCEKVLPYVETRDEEYFERFHLTIEDPYMLPYKARQFKSLPNVTFTDTTPYDEDGGDICLSKIMGTFQENGQSVPLCTTDKGCLDMMTLPGTSGYTLTHQLLYFILADKMECREELETMLQTKQTVDKIQTRMCERIYLDAEQLAKRGNVDDGDQDLFMEQTSLCGVLGFENFMQADWIRMVLKWQNAEGCFTLGISDLQNEMTRVVRDSEVKIEQMMSDLKRPGARKLLRESLMRDGCMSHKSGLGFSTLATYLRYLLRLKL